jgi:AbrB family looped-hinge helix DNA binding protein
MTFTTVSSKYQIVIPKEIHEHMNIKPGQKLQLVEINGRIVIIQVMPIESYRGMFPNFDTSNYRDEEDREI